MKLKNAYFYTLRDDVKEEDSTSGNLLVRSGMIRKNSAGVYMYLPLGLKVLKNIENIIREEMNNIDSQEVLMPALVYEDYYEASGRKEKFGPSVFTLKDRASRPYVLGPTHEELFALASSYKIKSYKDLPFSLYQIQNKFRDEARPRYGLIRVREFFMKDSYTFDKDYAGLDKSYQAMYDAYKRIFERIGIDYRIVKADTGVMGGLLSEEFQAITDIGEDTLVICSKCDYSSNLEVAEIKDISKPSAEVELEREVIDTPNVGTIEDLVNNYNFDIKKLVKSLIYVTDKNKIILVMIRGDRSLNEVKLAKVLECNEVALGEESVVREVTNAKLGFAGPIGLNSVKIIADNEIKSLKNFIVGANMDDKHIINVNLKDVEIDNFVDIRLVEENDVCPNCGALLEFKKGIEVGNTFKLGDKYAKTMGVTYLDQENKLKPVIMGSYGIGLGRCMAAVVEQNNDENGIIFPIAIAPYKVAIVIINSKDEIQQRVAYELYDELSKNNIEVLLDDRDERPGVKFNDMDLIGIPIRITIGKKAVDNILEFKLRNSLEVRELPIKDIIDEIKTVLQ